MAAPVSVREDQLTRLVALSPGDGRIGGLVRQVCAQAVSLPPLPAEVEMGEPESDAEAVIAEFAEQFSVDVSAITAEQRSRLWKQLGESTFGVVVLIYIADFIPRVRAGLEVLGVGDQYLGWTHAPISWAEMAASWSRSNITGTRSPTGSSISTVEQRAAPRESSRPPRSARRSEAPRDEPRRTAS